MREVLPLRPDGHTGEGLGRKKLDPCSNSSWMLWTGEAGPAEGINTQTAEAGWKDLSITRCLHFVCTSMWYILCVRVCVCVCVEGGEREEGRGSKKERKRKKCELGLNNLQPQLLSSKKLNQIKFKCN